MYGRGEQQFVTAFGMLRKQSRNVVLCSANAFLADAPDGAAFAITIGRSDERTI